MGFQKNIEMRNIKMAACMVIVNVCIPELSNELQGVAMEQTDMSTVTCVYGLHTSSLSVSTFEERLRVLQIQLDRLERGGFFVWCTTNVPSCHCNHSLSHSIWLYI